MKNPEGERTDSGFSSYGKALRTAGPLFTSGLQMAVAVGLLCFLGYLSDKQFGTTPWLMVTGVFVGAAAGFYLFMRTVSSLDKNKPERNNENV
ncbi:MAG: AtpZ/AtpI family protein [Ignavibacteria bacterium]|nr:AtpZ/AtpI family protein [Ignavibacteria bacterium]MBI3765387.1 AtpZ/AtpI family protein [Ignavibacteriales bacterium]